MPEESFEQQARRKAEEFGIEPSAKVWQHVKASISPEKRRRKILFWWWLLPLCLAGSVVAWLLKSGEGVHPEPAAIVLDENKKTDKKQPKPASKEKKEPAEVSIEKQRGEEWKKTLEHKKEIVLVDRLDDEKKRNLAEMKPRFAATREHKNNTKTIPGKETKFIAKNDEELLQSEERLLPQNQISGQVLQDEPVMPSPAIIKDGSKHTESMKPDTVLLAVNQFLPGKKAAGTTSTTKQKKQLRGWQTGVTADFGLVSWTKGLLADLNSSPSAFTSSPPGSDVNDSMKALISLQTKNGISAGAGIIFRKPVSKRLYITARFGYRYQKYKMYQLSRTSIPQPAGSSIYIIGLSDYHAHFVNASVHAGIKVLSTKRNLLSAEMGVDNGFLLMAQTQKGDSAQSSRITQNNSAKDFYRWQPQLSVFLPFAWHRADKISLRVAPFAQWGLHSFQKNGDSYKTNHLVSAGLQVVYFFK